MNEDWIYASVIGMIMYLASNSLPDIMFYVHQCSRFTHSPKKIHENSVKKIVRYLLGTRDEGLRLQKVNEMKLECYVDEYYSGLWKYE